MLFLRNIAKFIIPVLIITVCCFVVNANINQHYHKLSSGFVVKHAHPYQKDSTGVPFQSHNHTSFEFFLLAQNSIVLFIFIIGFAFIRPVPFLVKEILFPLFVLDKQSDFYLLKNYRAPPFIV